MINYIRNPSCCCCSHYGADATTGPVCRIRSRWASQVRYSRGRTYGARAQRVLLSLLYVLLLIMLPQGRPGLRQVALVAQDVHMLDHHTLMSKLSYPSASECILRE